mmetsp:Transcript_2167/g.8627  ORF Transcript_2167/g.8627 Transcript_2167/m.8627 type:complete len:204 (+) Transcript_2167:934-1545(+)
MHVLSGVLRGPRAVVAVVHGHVRALHAVAARAGARNDLGVCFGVVDDEVRVHCVPVLHVRPVALLGCTAHHDVKGGVSVPVGARRSGRALEAHPLQRVDARLRHPASFPGRRRLISLLRLVDAAPSHSALPRVPVGAYRASAFLMRPLPCLQLLTRRLRRVACGRRRGSAGLDRHIQRALPQRLCNAADRVIAYQALCRPVLA